MSSTVADTAKKRMRFVLLLSILLLVIIAGRLFWVQGINPAAAAKEAADTRNRVETIAPTRGSILDKNGNILALSLIHI